MDIDPAQPTKISEKECNQIKNLMKAKRESLNNSLVKIIDTQCAADREALLQTKVRFKRLQEEGSEQTKALKSIGLTEADKQEITAEVAKLQFDPDME